MKNNKYSLLFIAIISAFTSHAQNNNYFEISKNLDVYSTLFKELNTYYVDGIEPGKLNKIAIDNMLNSLDPYTNYITESDVEDYKFQTTGKYGGIGSSVREKNDYIAIGLPYENSPVVKAGIKSGDLIIEIDGRSIKGKNEDDVSPLLKGSPGSKLTMKIRDGVTGVETVKTVTREEINVTSVPYAAMVGAANNIAYVRLTQFTQNCGSLVRSSFDSLKKANPTMKACILDMRYNPGGLLDEAVNICNIFINGNQTVVTTKGKVDDWNNDFKTKGAAWDEKIPVAVLVNRNSASASEVVAGTLQDIDRAVVVGQRSFGKGLVQTTRPLSFNTQLKVTTAKYYTPSGRCVQALDYSHRNEDGSLGKVSDSLKTMFKTKNGRKVYDGGGVEPDITTDAKEANRLVSTLVNNNLIFDYATLYKSKHPSITAPNTFTITDAEFNEFATWLKDKDYSYKTRTEEILKKLKESAEKENYLAAIKTDIEQVEKTLSHDKDQDILKSKKDITHFLQQEIVGRYYYQKGIFQNDLNNDIELTKAIEVLNNEAQYKNILGFK
jgi:carboxyl-terminal processing protease